MHKFSGVLFSLLISLVVLVGGTGCSSQNSQVPVTSALSGLETGDCTGNGEANPGIVGGQKASLESWVGRSVVALFFTRLNGSRALCTGTLIDSNLILTAAHCADPLTIREIAVIFLKDPKCNPSYSAENPVDIRMVERVVLHPGYNANSVKTHDDLAIARIPGVAPWPYRSFPLTGTAEPLSADSSMLLAGFGNRAGFAPETGHELYSTLVSVYSGSNIQKSLRQMGDRQIYLDQRKRGGACAGDSGGPAFFKNARGEYEVLGVAAAVDPLETGDSFPEDGISCQVGSVYTSVVAYRDWIESTFRSLKNANSEKDSPFAP